jgi:hypothetical protein
MSLPFSFQALVKDAVVINIRQSPSHPPSSPRPAPPLPTLVGDAAHRQPCLPLHQSPFRQPDYRPLLSLSGNDDELGREIMVTMQAFYNVNANQVFSTRAERGARAGVGRGVRSWGF